MAKSPVLGIRVPPDLLEQIDSLASTSGKTRSEVVLSLIQQGLGISPSPDTDVILHRLDELEKKLLTC